MIKANLTRLQELRETELKGVCLDRPRSLRELMRACSQDRFTAVMVDGDYSTPNGSTATFVRQAGDVFTCDFFRHARGLGRSGDTLNRHFVGWAFLKTEGASNG